eukprot:12457150-Prorocentrum_lima.AAC.1
MCIRDSAWGRQHSNLDTSKKYKFSQVAVDNVAAAEALRAAFKTFKLAGELATIDKTAGGAAFTSSLWLFGMLSDYQK